MARLERRLLSVVRRRSNPVSSATFSNSPLVSVSQPCALLLDRMRMERTTNPSWRAMVKEDEHLSADRRFQAARGKFEHGIDLLAGYVKLLHNLFDGEAIFQILEDGCDGQARAAKDPGAAYFSGMLSTASQADQSSAIPSPLQVFYRKPWTGNEGRRKASTMAQHFTRPTPLCPTRQAEVLRRGRGRRAGVRRRRQARLR